MDKARTIDMDKARTERLRLSSILGTIVVADALFLLFVAPFA
ncbi:MAG TPA: hypothetical protein VHH72_00835 [Solirubrobacterales bacterium]|jgi:hypothetical protein|nr:hypothetical protein [Solirubrobacterales bacterium]HEX2467390.1 hypothetical protein [Solirubrobacterales bacterium]